MKRNLSEYLKNIDDLDLETIEMLLDSDEFNKELTSKQKDRLIIKRGEKRELNVMLNRNDFSYVLFLLNLLEKTDMRITDKLFSINALILGAFYFFNEKLQLSIFIMVFVIINFFLIFYLEINRRKNFTLLLSKDFLKNHNNNILNRNTNLSTIVNFIIMILTLLSFLLLGYKLLKISI